MINVNVLETICLAESGQLQESSRDQGHAQLSIGLRGNVCEMAWKQGVDLYSANNNALLRGTEYTVSYNLGNTVPFQEHLDYCLRIQTTGALTQISSIGRGTFGVLYEQIYNHYAYRQKKAMPFTRQYLSSLNAAGGEGAPNVNSPVDYTGYGSLLFYLATTETHDLKAVPVQETDWRNFKVTPTVASDFLTIQTPENTAVKAIISNALGQTMSSHTINSTFSEINVQHLTKGIYILTVQIEAKKQKSFKFFKN